MGVGCHMHSDPALVSGRAKSIGEKKEAVVFFVFSVVGVGYNSRNGSSVRFWECQRKEKKWFPRYRCGKSLL